MKKLFTLVVAAFAAVTVFAQTKDVCLRNYKYGMVIQGAAAKLTKVEWIKVDTPTGISNATVTLATQDAKIYNLAGQQVDASYKGVVIKNGKKYVQ